MVELDAVIIEATARVAPPYFLLPIPGGNAVSRERVYCYELYHQMRSLWPAGCRYLLNGEVDKRAHLAMHALGVHNEKPDFLVHNPRVMDDNHAIIEVKAYRTAAQSIRKDFRTLTLFRQGPHYDRAVYLFYGDGDQLLLSRRIESAASDVEAAHGIEVWHHRAPGAPAEQIGVI